MNHLRKSKLYSFGLVLASMTSFILFIFIFNKDQPLQQPFLSSQKVNFGQAKTPSQVFIETKDKSSEVNEPTPTQTDSSSSKEITSAGKSPPIQTPINFQPAKTIRNNQAMKEKAIDREGANAYLESGGVIGARDPRALLLCRLNLNGQCNSLYPSDMVDTFYVFLPIYAEDQGSQENLYNHHQNFVSLMKSIGLQTVVLEAIYSGQGYLRTHAGNEPSEIQLKIDDTFYYRENLLNVAIKKTKGWEYATWIDAHQTFLNTYWFEETILKLEHYNMVQMFQTLVWLNNFNNGTDPVQDLDGVQYVYTTTKDLNHYFKPPTAMWNGNAVGVRREIYEELGYVLDECIAGCCDCALNVAAMADHWDRVDRFPNYATQLNPWINKASKVLQGKVSVVRGRMYHFYHDHFFPWDKYLNGLGHGSYSIATDTYRDNNFTLHIKDNSPLSTLFTKRY